MTQYVSPYIGVFCQSMNSNHEQLTLSQNSPGQSNQAEARSAGSSGKKINKYREKKASSFISIEKAGYSAEVHYRIHLKNAMLSYLWGHTSSLDVSIRWLHLFFKYQVFFISHHIRDTCKKQSVGCNKEGTGKCYSHFTRICSFQPKRDRMWSMTPLITCCRLVLPLRWGGGDGIPRTGQNPRLSLPATAARSPSIKCSLTGGSFSSLPKATAVRYSWHPNLCLPLTNSERLCKEGTRFLSNCHTTHIIEQHKSYDIYTKSYIEVWLDSQHHLL